MFFWPLAALVLTAPLFKAGNRALPLMLLELVAAALLVAIALRGPRVALPRTLAAALALLLAYPLVQLVPLPDALWRILPGHAGYAAIAERFGAPGERPWRAISVLPAPPEYGWLALLPPLACALGVRRLSPEQATRLLVAMAALAGAASVLGLLQAAAGRGSVFHLGNAQAPGTAAGPFVNPGHFAALLAMMLPVIVALLAVEFRRRRAGLTGADVLAQRALLFASAVLVVVCLMFTRSRSGIATALVGCAAVAGAMFAQSSPRRRSARALGLGLMGAGLALALAAGFSPLVDKFAPDAVRASAGGRLALNAATLRAAVDFLPFGSGLSTFATVFPQYQDRVFGGYVDYAHNDYLQFFLETGVVAVLVVALLLVAYLLRMRELLRRTDRRSFTLLQVACGVGLLPLALHSLFDFPLHIPANAIWFATLAGVLLHAGVPPAARNPSTPANAPATVAP